MFWVSISILLEVSHEILTPRPFKISHRILTSAIFGKFFIIQVPLISNDAGRIAKAEFFAPLIVTSPF